MKGKTEPEAIYTLVGGDDTLQDIRFQKLSKVYLSILHCYRNRDWEGALEALQLCRTADENFGLTGLFDLYQARVQACSENAPPPDWIGVFVAESK